MNYRNAQYISATVIDCEINHPNYGWIPYTLDPSDTDMTVNNTDLLSNMFAKGDIATYIAPTQGELDEALATELRIERDFKLVSEVDPIVTNPLRWAELTSASQESWIQYRADLQAVPEQSGFPNNIIWPTKPE